MTENFRLPTLSMFAICSWMGGYQGDKTTGFQSPAQDYIESVVDLAAVLDLRRPGRYPVRVKGQALEARGIRDGDILITDAAAEPRPGVVCVAMIGGDVILATLARRGGDWLLIPSSGISVAITEDVEVWAVVHALVRTEL
jgi:SOS-response transcriptional repressor LexA